MGFNVSVLRCYWWYIVVGIIAQNSSKIISQIIHSFSLVSVNSLPETPIYFDGANRGKKSWFPVGFAFKPMTLEDFVYGSALEPVN